MKRSVRIKNLLKSFGIGIFLTFIGIIIGMSFMAL